MGATDTIVLDTVVLDTVVLDSAFFPARDQAEQLGESLATRVSRGALVGASVGTFLLVLLALANS